MNLTIVQITLRSLLGRKRVILFVLLALVVLGMATVIHLVGDPDVTTTDAYLWAFAFGIAIPLTCLISGTGVISNEIDDGAIVYLLSKPISRFTIVWSKLIVAVLVTIVFGVIPLILAGLIMSNDAGRLVLAYGMGAVVAASAYNALFLFLSTISRHAAIIGLGYALVWESLIAGYVPGAKAISVRQWSAAVIEKIFDDRLRVITTLDPAVGLVPSLILLIVITGLAIWYGVEGLKKLRMTSED